MDLYLKKVYYDLDSRAGYVGPTRLLKEVQRLGKKKVTLDYIEKWLNKQPAYTLYRKVLYKFKRPPMVAYRLNENWQIDLLDMSRYASENKGTKFLLTVIDVLSKRAYVKPLKSKQASEVASQFKLIIKSVQPVWIYADNGSEFKGEFKKLLDDRGIKLVTTNQTVKGAVIERYNRSLRSMIIRYLKFNNTLKYIDQLQKLVRNYNHSYHKTIKMVPMDVTEKNDYT